MKRPLLVMLLFCLLGCNGDANVAAPLSETAMGAPPFDLVSGFTAEALPYSFRGPTQFFVDGDELWVAQLNGGESEAKGQIVRLDLQTGAETIVLDGLDKPTGVALLGGSVWVATRDALLRAPLDEPTALETVLDNLPNNGRSNGTLTVTPDGMLLYETSGRRSIPESGRLYEFDPATDESKVLATGLKNAYAHAFDSDGRLWITEIADGSIEGVTYPGEINWVIEGANFGWPTCYGRNLAGPMCDGVRPAVLVLPEHSTPTGIAVSPFSSDTLFVALWVTGEVLEIPLSISGNDASGGERRFISGMQNPQHLFTHPDGSLWVSEFETGRIWVIRQEGSTLGRVQIRR